MGAVRPETQRQQARQRHGPWDVSVRRGAFQPPDLGHNFVLAHDKCNNAKTDFLAAENHLAAWIERNREHQVEMNERLVAAALPCDVTATVQIAKWVYQQTEKSNGQVWVIEKVLRHLGPDWTRCFAA